MPALTISRKGQPDIEKSGEIFYYSERVREYNELNAYDGKKVSAEIIVPKVYLTENPQQYNIEIRGDGKRFKVITLEPFSKHGSAVTTFFGVEILERSANAN